MLFSQHTSHPICRYLSEVTYPSRFFLLREVTWFVVLLQVLNFFPLQVLFILVNLQMLVGIPPWLRCRQASNWILICNVLFFYLLPYAVHTRMVLTRVVLTHGIAEVMGLCSVPSMWVDRTDQLDKGSDGFQIDVLFYLSLNFHTHTHTHTHRVLQVMGLLWEIQNFPSGSDLVLFFYTSFIAHAL